MLSNGKVFVKCQRGLLAFCLFSFLVVFTASSALSNQMLPRGCPMTPRRLWDCLYPLREMEKKIPIDAVQMESLTYCLMDHIEHKYGPIDEMDYQQCVKLLCKGYSSLGYKDWDSEHLKKDKLKLFEKLKLSLAGQRYLKFPRASMTAQGAIRLRFPEPSVYGLSANQIIIDRNHPRFGHQILALQYEDRKNNEEFVEISKGRHGDFDWDTDYWMVHK